MDNNERFNILVGQFLRNKRRSLNISRDELLKKINNELNYEQLADLELGCLCPCVSIIILLSIPLQFDIEDLKQVYDNYKEMEVYKRLKEMKKNGK